ncbi:MAG: glutathione-dependent formaldehyde dehydrogenase [Polyangiaceae bacterium]|nr:glutathione-dependent formaldehyde dehydrogenase [Polyangiaceae bacterium]
MRALVFHRPKKVTVDNVADPRIVEPTDVVLRVTATAICGSDLHIFNGLIPQVKPMTLGHEFMGVVEEVGSEVTKLEKGDRVFVPFPIACGACWFCNRGLPVHCEVSNKNYGPEGGLLKEKGGGLFGYTDVYGGYQGGQAEYVRVPFADVGPRKVPDAMSDESVLFLTDILPTGYSAIEWSDMKGGETVAVFGCGPVGIMAMKCAWLKGASRVIGIDREAYRLERARGAAKADVMFANDETIERIRAMTDGRGADVVVDAVGMEAHRTLGDKVKNAIHVQVGTIDVLRSCVSAVRRGGTISIVGVYGVPYDNFPIGQMFDKGIRVGMGQALVHRYVDDLLELVVAGKLRADDVISHRLPLADAPHAYDIFNKKEDDCLKVVLRP